MFHLLSESTCGHGMWGFKPLSETMLVVGRGGGGSSWFCFCFGFLSVQKWGTFISGYLFCFFCFCVFSWISKLILKPDMYVIDVQGSCIIKRTGVEVIKYILWGVLYQQWFSCLSLIKQVSTSKLTPEGLLQRLRQHVMYDILKVCLWNEFTIFPNDAFI